MESLHEAAPRVHSADRGSWTLDPDGADVAPYTAADADWWAGRVEGEPRIAPPFVAPADDDDRVRLIDPDGGTFDALLELAERAGFEGDHPPMVTGLDAGQAGQLVAVWAAGRAQRAEDEIELARERCAAW